MPRPGTCRSLTMCNVWWIVWVPCYRSVPCLCYDFDRLTRRGYLFACKYTGCENGTQYSWWEACFGLVGFRELGARTICRIGELADEGNCG